MVDLRKDYLTKLEDLAIDFASVLIKDSKVNPSITSCGVSLYGTNLETLNFLKRCMENYLSKCRNDCINVYVNNKEISYTIDVGWFLINGLDFKVK